MPITFGEYVRNVSAHLHAGYRIDDRGEFVIWEGKEYAPKEFDAMFPTSVFPRLTINKLKKGDNCDPRANWLNGEKSYN